MSEGFWGELERPAPVSAVVGGVELRRGSRVVLRPRAGADVFDLALAGRLATVESLEQDVEGALHVAVTLDDDPGRELGEGRFPGHRFFFGTDEVEPLADVPGHEPAAAGVLVAGIGNVFLGDDGFGVAVAAELARRDLPGGADVVDFGIRGLDLAYALQEPYEAVVFVDAAPRGEAPGTISVVEPELPDDGGDAVVNAHGLDPLRVLSLARQLGRVPPRVLVVACEPARVVDGAHDDDLVGELSAPVQAAVAPAADTVEELLVDLLAGDGRR